MGIKDNFSQAVKELWKKDSENNSDPKIGSQTTELDKYLQQPAADQGMSNQARPAGSGGVPLETPYYRTPEQQAAADAALAAQQQAAAAAAQSANPIDPSNAGYTVVGERTAYQQGGAEQPINQNAQNAINARNAQNNMNSDIGQNFGQNNQNYNQNAVGAQAGGYERPSDYGGYGNDGNYAPGNPGNYNANRAGGGGFVPPSAGGGMAGQNTNETDELTVISKNTSIDGNVRSLANMRIDGNIKGNVETTKNVDMSGKIVGDITCNNAGMNAAAMQGNVSLKGRMRMDRDTILIGDLSSQYADINGRIRGKLDIVGKAELKRDAIVFGDINASTIAVTDGAIIQGYVNTTFLSKEDSRNVFPEAISLENKENPNN